MTVEIISWSISTKVWDRAGIKLATPGSAVRHVSVARHVTDACLTAEPNRCDKAYTGDNPHLMHQSFVSTAPLMQQSFVSTAPSPTGMGGDSDFSLFRVLWGQADGNNLLLAQPYTTENLTGVSVPMLKPPQFPGTAGTIKKYLHFTIAHRYPSRWGGAWIQMTGA